MHAHDVRPAGVYINLAWHPTFFPQISLKKKPPFSSLLKFTDLRIMSSVSEPPKQYGPGPMFFFSGFCLSVKMIQNTSKDPYVFFFGTSKPTQKQIMAGVSFLSSQNQTSDRACLVSLALQKLRASFHGLVSSLPLFLLKTTMWNSYVCSSLAAQTIPQGIHESGFSRRMAGRFSAQNLKCHDRILWPKHM